MLCSDCPTRNECKVICKDLENYLQREKSKDGYSFRHIRRREIPFSPEQIEYRQICILDEKFGIKLPKNVLHREDNARPYSHKREE